MYNERKYFTIGILARNLDDVFQKYACGVHVPCNPINKLEFDLFTERALNSFSFLETKIPFTYTAIVFQFEKTEIFFRAR